MRCAHAVRAAALVALASCARPPNGTALTVAPAAGARDAGSPAVNATPGAVDWGMYRAEGSSSCAVVPRATGGWIVCLGSEGGVRALDAGATVAGPYTLTPGGVRTPQATAPKYADPFYERIIAKLGGHTFQQWHGAAKLVTRDALLVAFDDTKRCSLGALFPDPTLNNARVVPAVAPQPARGTLGSRTFLLLGIDRECGDDAPTTELAVRGGGVVVLVARWDGTPLGIVMLGYMYAESFMTPEASTSEQAQVGELAAHELAHQAE